MYFNNIIEINNKYYIQIIFFFTLLNISIINIINIKRIPWMIFLKYLFQDCIDRYI